MSEHPLKTNSTKYFLIKSSQAFLDQIIAGCSPKAAPEELKLTYRS